MGGWLQFTEKLANLQHTVHFKDHAMRYLIMSGLFLAISFSRLGAQEEFYRFSPELDQYPEELGRFMNEGSTEAPAEGQILSPAQSLIQQWNAGILTDTLKSVIRLTSNQLLDKNARPNPHFNTFLRIIDLYLAEGSPDDNFLNWIASMIHVTASDAYNLNQVDDYLSFMQRLLQDGILNQTKSTVWQSSNPVFSLRFDDSVMVDIRETDLVCYAVRDSLAIFGTSGTYMPLSNLWQGLGGRVTWARSGLDAEKVYAGLGNYQVDMRFYEFRADSVSFHNTYFVDFELKGMLEHKVERVISSKRTTYPRFESYQADYRLNDIYENIDYSGGLNMQGARLIGSGTRWQKASLRFFRNDTIIIYALSEYFSFEPERISGVNTEIHLYTDMDSIYHPSTGVNYFVDENRLSCFRTENFQSQSPYFNSYHKLEMNFEQLSWMLDDNIILFKMEEGAASGLANFQSANLFDMQTYMRLQGIDLENPLVALRRMSEKEFNISFYGQDFAGFTRTRPEQMQQILIRLAVMGFIIYDLENDYVTLRQKTYDWIYASVDYIDYDVINLNSEITGLLENASLDLTTNDLHINGVRSIQLSNAQNVRIVPAGQQVTMKRNRDFVFDGTIYAGLFTVYGKNFLFNYDDFKINLTDIDSLSIRVASDEFDAYGQTSLLNVQSIIEDMTGELLIDDPENKSGRKKLPSYPILSSTEYSFIYYDDQEIQDGVYERDRFYFEIYPFTFDSLDNFTSNSLNLEGRFHSADIFPDFEQTLCYLQDDNSLGFTYNTDEDGLPIYQGQGHYNDYIQMSNAGLRGKGTFTYLTSRARSSDIIFHPDSLFTNAEEFNIGQQITGTQYPSVRSAGNDLLWYPYGDLMTVEEGSEPFSILNDSTRLSGSLALTPQGLKGEGTMELTNSVLHADEFTYLARVFDADTADFRLKSVNTDGFTLITDNVNAHVDFENRSGLFRTNEDFALVEFPENRYISRLDLFRWEMDNTRLVMGSASATDTMPEIVTRSDGEVELAGPRYLSTDPLQDSLSWVSNRAVYDYNRNLLRGEHVTFIRVADAYIYPGEGEIVIQPNGEMGEIRQASIIANRTTRMHEFYDATVQVQGRNSYTGGGYYDFIDETGEIQVIHFSTISVGDSIRTLAEGMIPETQDFTLSPYFGYQGRVELSAMKPLLTFNGGARLFHDCECNEDRYVRFNAEIDPNNIYIPVEQQPMDINMNYAYAGIFLANDSVHVYPSFFSTKKLPRDRFIVTSEGYLYYDMDADEYRVASMEKLAERDVPGNYLSISRSDCIEYGEGKVYTNVFPGQVMMSSVGNATHNMETDSTEMNIALAMDFFMSEDAWEIMATEIDSLHDLEGTDMTDPGYMKVISELVGRNRAEALQAEMGLYGEYTSELPDELNHTLFFTDIKFVWNQDTRSWQSAGKISLGSINGRQVNKVMDGIMEFSKRRSGDLLDIQLELDSRTWYYFGYTRGVMHVLSSNRDFNNTINDLKTNQRRMKTARNEIPYVFIVATARKRAMFLERMQGIPAPVQ